MRLSGKLALALTVVATFISSAVAIAKPFIFPIIIEDPTNLDVLTFGTEKVTFTKGQGAVLLEALNSLKTRSIDYSTKLFSPRAANEISGDIELNNGVKINVSVKDGLDASSTKQTVDITVTPTLLLPGNVDPKPVEIDSASIDFTVLTDITVVDAPATGFDKISGIAAADHPIIKVIINNGGFFSKNCSLATLYIAGTAPTVDTHICYNLTDKKRLLCVKYVAGTPGLVLTVKNAPSQGIGGWLKENVPGPVVVFLVAAILTWLFAKGFQFADEEGYQAGKAESSLPGWFKSCLPGDDDFGGDDYYGEMGEEGAEGDTVVRLDPNTGRPVRMKKNGAIVGDNDESAETDSEKTDAFGVSVMAGLLVVPFLLL